MKCALFLALLGAWADIGVGGTIYVNRASTGDVESGSFSSPFRTLAPAEEAVANGDSLIITSGDYHEALTFSTNGQVRASGGPVTIGLHPWGRLANAGFAAKPIKTTLFYAGRPLDGTTFDNGCGPSANATNFYSLWPVDQQHLNWVDPADPTSSANRDFVVQSMVDAGLNVISMSSWGESWLPCTNPCPQVPDCGCQKNDCTQIYRCFTNGPDRFCRIGWFGAANMQVSPTAKNQLFDAAVSKPILIIPFIESRFLYDWNFHDEFPTNGALAPGLISQIEDLLNVYVLHPLNPAWPAKWAQVYDQDGQARYAVSIVQVATDRLNQGDPGADAAFAAGFDAVAQQVFADTQLLVGFFIDPIAPDPTSAFGCPDIDITKTFSVYSSNFKASPEVTGPYLRRQKSILGIQCFSPEGWIDGRLGTGYAVDACYKLNWKWDFSRRWFKTGIPFLQDVTPGYNSTLLFANRNPDGGLKKWGYDDQWRGGLTQMVREFGQAGVVYNAWNGYPEGLAAMEVVDSNGVQLPRAATIDWLKSLTALYP
jgi:hypothetical protein